MPKFFISFRNGGQTIQDEVGQDFPTLTTPKTSHWLPLANWSRITSSPILRTRSRAVIITDENGKELMTIPAREALTQPLK
jgi:hypothetical protein